MSYTFRIRFIPAPNNAIHSEETEIAIPAPNQPGVLAIRNPKRQPLKDAERLVLVGTGYASEQQAIEAGTILQMALKVSLAKVRIGVDFGEEAPKGRYTEAGLSMLSAEHEKTVLNDVHGLMVFRTDLNPKFAAIEAVGVRGVNPQVVATTFAQCIAKWATLSDQDLLAYSLFNGSFFQVTQTGRFLLLIMAIEALIAPAPRSTEAIDHVNEIIKMTQSASIPPSEKTSIIGALEWLRNESINQAGKRLALDRLSNRTYGNRTAPQFFSHCYELRSLLVHGKLPVSRHEEIRSLVAMLEIFVADLLTVPVLG